MSVTFTATAVLSDCKEVLMSGNVVAEMARVTCEEYYVEDLVTWFWAGEEEEEPPPEDAEPEPAG